jgi:hypothetical protein
MANPINTAPSQERVEVINLDVLDKRLTSDKIEWYCEWVKGGDPERRIRVDQDTPLDSFLESVKRLLKNKSTKDRAAYKIGVLTILAHGYGRCEYKNAKAYAKGSCTIKQVHAGFVIKTGLSREAIILDPGIDFAKQRPDNLRIYRELGRLNRFERPILLPVSRKTVIGEVLDLPEPRDRDPGTIACVVAGMQQGATIFRVHNVNAASLAVRAVWSVLEG